MAFKMYFITSLFVSGIVAINNQVVFNGYNLTDISDYGCWCRFSGDMKRHGEPLDEIDKLCHTYWQNIHCMQVDNLLIEEHELRAVQHNMINAVWATETSDIVSQCENANMEGTKIERITCKLHANFVFQIFQKFFSGTFVREEFKVRNGFIFEENCHAPEILSLASKNSDALDMGKKSNSNSRNIATNGDDSFYGPEIARVKKECCGEYPYKTPYVPALNRACCGEKTYDKSKNVCCGNTIVNYGDDC